MPLASKTLNYRSTRRSSMADRDPPPNNAVSIDLEPWSEFYSHGKLKAGDSLVYFTTSKHKRCNGSIQSVQYNQQNKLTKIMIQIEEKQQELVRKLLNFLLYFPLMCCLQVDSIPAFCQAASKVVSESPKQEGFFAHLFVLPKGEQIQKPKRAPGTVCKIRIVGPKEIKLKDLPDWANKRNFINATSKSSKPWSRGLSPFYLGPVELPSGDTAQVMENAWQFSKVFKQHTDHNNDPTKEYLTWARQGMSFAGIATCHWN